MNSADVYCCTNNAFHCPALRTIGNTCSFFETVFNSYASIYSAVDQYVAPVSPCIITADCGLMIISVPHFHLEQRKRSVVFDIWRTWYIKGQNAAVIIEHGEIVAK